MITLKIFTKLGVFEIEATEETNKEVQDFVKEIMMDRLKYVCGVAKSGSYIFLAEEVLKDCVIEIIESEEDNASTGQN